MTSIQRIAAAFGVLAALVFGGRMAIEMRDLRVRVRDAEGEIIVLRARLPRDPRVAELVQQVGECRQRTDDLRAVLETLIKTDRWPGRVSLPKPVSSWGPWPTRGDNIGSISDPNPGWK